MDACCIPISLRSGTFVDKLVTGSPQLEIADHVDGLNTCKLTVPTKIFKLK